MDDEVWNYNIYFCITLENLFSIYKILGYHENTRQFEFNDNSDNLFYLSSASKSINI